MLDRIARWWRFRSLDRGEFVEEGERPVGNVDAWAAAGSSHVQGDGGGVFGTGGYPPGYVKGYDEGRPKK